MKTKIDKMKKTTNIILSLFMVAGLFGLLPTKVFATNEVNMYLFWGQGCPHCAQEKEFLVEEVLPKYSNAKLSTYEIYYSQENIQFMRQVSDKLGADANGVPFLVIGDKYFVGYADGVTDKEIETKIKYCSENSCEDSVASIVKNTNQNNTDSVTKQAEKEENSVTKKIISLPILGEIDAMDFSLPVLAVVMGFVDGFNPCAMWTLLFLISLLLGLNNRRRMWLLGTVFIVVSAFVYFLFMAAWLQLILFLGFVVWVRLIIGLVAVFAGGFNVRSYIKEKGNVGCKVTGSEKRQLVFAKMRSIAQQNSLWLALGGITLLAFAVNLVELVCSAGFPVIFTQVLALSSLDGWQYYGYILLYILFFMLDDIIIFGIAMTTLRATGISTKYSKWSKLIGGVLMLIIGLLLILKPEWLMFG